MHCQTWLPWCNMRKWHWARASGFELVPLNDGYASIRSEDGATILGTVVEWHIYR